MRDNGFENRHRHQRNERGFTLVELLVVISIIGILVALITPAIFAAVKRAKVARIKIEMASMSQAMEAYRTEYGNYPPDLSFRPTTDVTLSNILDASVSNNDHLVMGQHLQRSFRARVVTPTAFDSGNILGADAIPSRAGLADQLWYPAYVPPATLMLAANTDLAEIDPSEALVLWLSGFSPDPRHPMRGDKHTPFFEFDRTRLVDHDGDGYPSYHPAGDNTQTPYLYFAPNSSNEAVAYNVTTANIVALNTSEGGIQANGIKRKIPIPYRHATLQTTDPAGNLVNNYMGATKFQIVSAGFDGKYVEDNYDAAAAASNPRGYNANPVPKAEKDNLSNFSDQGTFQDAVDD